LAPSSHLNLDDAWAPQVGGLTTIDARDWGPQLRFAAPSALIESFFREYNTRLAPFLLYGSGDFHHLSALWIRRTTGRIVVVSFDNHPDWDVRPPKWACGGWVNRALELPQVDNLHVWGCGNFECWWPAQLFGNRRAEREGKLTLHAWADGHSAARQRRAGAIFRATWRDRFERFVQRLGGARVYVTIDLDCLRAGDAVTNWENGRFTLDDLAWAIETLRNQTEIVAGDMCGAFSPPKYARAGQRFIAGFDHPKLRPTDLVRAQEINAAAFGRLWPILAER
jgi:hypothetical protein